MLHLHMHYLPGIVQVFFITSSEITVTLSITLSISLKPTVYDIVQAKDRTNIVMHPE